MMQHSFSIALLRTFVVLAEILTSELDQPQGPEPEGSRRQNYYQGDMSEGSTAACRISNYQELLVMISKKAG